MAKCETCDGPLASNRGRGQARKFCSERCRKAQYDLECVDCGARVSGADPGKRAGREPRCQSCAAAHRSVLWTREAIIAAMRRWADLYGNPPSVADWNPWQARHKMRDEARAERFGEGLWPSVDTVFRVFGSWSGGVAAAGFVPRAPHGGGGNELLRRV